MRLKRAGLNPWEDPLEEEVVTHSSILARENPRDREARWATVRMGLLRVGQD